MAGLAGDAGMTNRSTDVAYGWSKPEVKKGKSVLPSSADIVRPPRHACFVPNPEVAASFDHLIGAGEQRGRHRKAEDLSGLEVDDQFKLSWLLDGEVGRLRATQNLVDIVGGAPE